MEWASNPEIWISLLTLSLLEVVLGIDNIIFISILSSKLPHHQQNKARKVGLGLADAVATLLRWTPYVLGGAVLLGVVVVANRK